MSGPGERHARLCALQAAFEEVHRLRGFGGLSRLAREAEAVQTLLERVEALSGVVQVEAVDEWLAACQGYDDALATLCALEEMVATARSLTRQVRSVVAVEEALEWALWALTEESETALSVASVGALPEEPGR